MHTNIKKISDKLFCDVPYSKSSAVLKDKIAQALEHEYNRLLESGQNELQALGELMHNYGTIEQAAAFAGAQTDVIESMQTVPTFSNRKAFVKKIWLVKLLAVLIAIAVARGLMYLLQGLLLLAPLYAVSVIIDFSIAALFFRLYRKNKAQLHFDTLCLSVQQTAQFACYCDRYKKRLVNSLFVLLGFIVNYSSIFERALVAHMNHDEVLVLITSNLHILAIGFFLFLYQVLVTTYFLNGVSTDEQTAIQRYTKRTALFCGIFLIGAFCITALLRFWIQNPFPILYLLTVLFIGIGLAVNYKQRVTLVIQNLRINRLRIAVFSTAGMLIFTVNSMKKEVYVLNPYLMGIAEVEHSEHEIDYDDSTGVYTITSGEGDFKILHLTDIHLGGSVTSSYKDYQALEACRKLITYTNPDFVIVTGDLVFPMGIMSLSLNNEAPVRQFATFMRNLGIPWAFTYGNHDTESMATGSREAIDTLYQSLSFKSSGNLLYPYVQPEISGRSNQMILLKNPDGSLRQALFLLDSNDYTGAGVNDYDFIHDDQVAWYQSQVEQLNAEQGGVISSMLFFHIPLQEYRTAYELYQSNSGEVDYYFGKIGETMINPICCSTYPSKLFDTAVSLGSTKAMFCGHDHYNNISLSYRGIRLTYGMSIDYLAMPGIDKDTEQRGGELITIHNNATFDIEQIPLNDIA